LYECLGCLCVGVHVCCFFIFFFFFQAEDGIRDRTVTGVQTCALPISRGAPEAARGSGEARSSPHRQGPRPVSPAGGGAGRGVLASAGLDRVPVAHWVHARAAGRRRVRGRSEERRVGKECSSSWLGCP